MTRRPLRIGITIGIRDVAESLWLSGFYIAIGFVCRRTGLVSVSFRKDLSRFILYVSLPAFLLHHMRDG